MPRTLRIFSRPGVMLPYALPQNKCQGWLDLCVRLWLISEMNSKRITLSGRDRYVIGKVLAYMAANASALNSEGACVVAMSKEEMNDIRNRVLANETKP
jgi:hypothetical protein